uniref:Uncharacterized protein n=1 Tax=Ditylenchus dipsaci TaxID=166011 RepID=A0A915DPQ1_9BILA
MITAEASLWICGSRKNMPVEVTRVGVRGAAAKPDVPAAKTDDKSPAAPAPAKSSVPPQHPDEPAFHLKLSPDQFIEFKSDSLLKGPVCADINAPPTNLPCASACRLKADETVRSSSRCRPRLCRISPSISSPSIMSAPERLRRRWPKAVDCNIEPEGIKRIQSKC